MDVDALKRVIDMPLSIDRRYNLIVCNDCGIGLPSEWVISHLHEQHGIVVTDIQVASFLGLDVEPVTLAEVEDWKTNAWVGKAVQNIPVVKGIRCTICQHSVGGKNVMKNHFTEKHKNISRTKHNEECLSISPRGNLIKVTDLNPGF